MGLPVVTMSHSPAEMLDMVELVSGRPSPEMVWQLKPVVRCGKVVRAGGNC